MLGRNDLIGRVKRAPHWAVQSRFRMIYIQVKKKAFKINAKIEDVGFKKYGNKKWSMINQNLKILHTASFFFYLSLQSLHYYSLFLLCTSSYCIKKSTFTYVMACLAFY